MVVHSVLWTMKWKSGYPFTKKDSNHWPRLKNNLRLPKLTKQVVKKCSYWVVSCVLCCIRVRQTGEERESARVHPASYIFHSPDSCFYFWNLRNHSALKFWNLSLKTILSKTKYFDLRWNNKSDPKLKHLCLRKEALKYWVRWNI